MKVRRFFAILLTLCMILATAPFTATPVYGLSGAGTAADPYQIATKADLEKFRNIVNGTNGETQNTAACAILTADINLENTAWTPIGSVIAGDTTTYNKYTGTFDGNGKTISGLFINAADAGYQGLFGYVDTAGEVCNVGVVSGSVTGKSFVGGVVARNDGTVENCYSTINVTGTNYVGGVVGQNTGSGKVQNCYNTGDVSASNYGDATTPMVGGVVGRNAQGTVDLCYNTGDVTSTGSNACAGGVVGQNASSGKVQNCYNTGDVSGTGSNYYVGGVVGESVGHSTISGCYNTGSVTASSSSTSTLLIDAAGGVVGYSYSENSFVRNCFNTGAVSGTSVGTDADIGGVVGYLGSKGKTENCYNTGNVSSTAAISAVGGVAGEYSTSATLTNCYYLKSSAQAGVGDNSALAVGLEAADLIDKTSFVGFDFTDVWYLGAGGPGLRVFGVNAYLPGSGTANGPYRIEDADQLFKFADIVSGTNGEAQNIYACAVLTADIDLNNAAWTPIGTFNSAYMGTFDGAGHAITNLNVNTDGKKDVGLFGYLRSATVKDLTVSGSVTCTYNGDNLSAGGLAGTIFSSAVEGCSFSGTVTGTAGSAAVGGLAGKIMASDVTGCRSSGTVSATSTANNGIYAGGFAGSINLQVGPTVTSCYSTASVTACNGLSSAGGFAGEIALSDNTVRDCYATGDATAQGGIDRIVGGFAGDIMFPNYSGSVETCYCLGLPSANGGEEKGFYGHCLDPDQVVNCLWMQGTPDTNSTTLIPVTADDLKNITTFRSNGFDLDTVWRFISGVSTKAELWAFVPHYVVTVTPAANMTNATDNVGDAQAVASLSAMKSVRYRADDGFYFPSDYAVAAVNGISVTRTDRVTLDVTGQPTDDAAVVLAAPTALPAITTQPADATPSFGNTTATLTVAAAADGHTLAYQWYSNTTASNSGGTAVSGAESASYTLPADLNAGSHYYYCVVTATHTTGGDVTTLTSNVATVTVDPRVVGYTGETEYHWPYTGAAQEKTFTIDGSYTLSPVDDYTVTYTKGGAAVAEMKDAGTYVAAYACKGNYTGEWTITFIIEPVKEDAPTGASFTATGADTGTLAGLVADADYAAGGAGIDADTPITADANGEYAFASGLAAGTLSVVTSGDGSNTFDSDPHTIAISKADVPALVAVQPAVIDGTGSIPTTAVHQKSADGTTWTDCDGTWADLAPDTYYVRVKASGTTLASDPQTIAIEAYDPPKEPTPNAAFTATGHDSGVLTGLALNDPHALNGAGLSNLGVATTDGEFTFTEGLVPGALTIVKTGNQTTTIDSAAQTITITRADAPVNVKAAGCTDIRDVDGRITGVDATMEYQKSGDAEWMAITDTVLTGLKPGDYLVRVKASGTALASEAVQVTVGHYVIPAEPEEPAPAVTGCPFTDISPEDYYYMAVLWAYEHGIVEGRTETAFDPQGTATRAEMVTFVWRAAGRPEPVITECPFVDVDPEAYYCKPVLWAFENGVTEGVDETHFDPDGTVDRAQAVTFLFRALGEETDAAIPFTDVPKDAYYAGAVKWAYAAGVTEGVSETSFDPDGDCLRCQAVTFLYRAWRKNEDETQGGADQ